MLLQGWLEPWMRNSLFVLHDQIEICRRYSFVCKHSVFFFFNIYYLPMRGAAVSTCSLKFFLYPGAGPSCSAVYRTSSWTYDKASLYGPCCICRGICLNYVKNNQVSILRSCQILDVSSTTIWWCRSLQNPPQIRGFTKTNMGSCCLLFRQTRQSSTYSSGKSSW